LFFLYFASLIFHHYFSTLLICLNYFLVFSSSIQIMIMGYFLLFISPFLIFSFFSFIVYILLLLIVYIFISLFDFLFSKYGSFISKSFCIKIYFLQNRSNLGANWVDPTKLIFFHFCHWSATYIFKPILKN